MLLHYGATNNQKVLSFYFYKKCPLVDSKNLFGGYELKAFLVKDSLARLRPDYSDIKNINIGHTGNQHIVY